MEHLARAAVDLHHRRTGRGKLHERAEAARLAAALKGGGGRIEGVAAVGVMHPSNHNGTGAGAGGANAGGTGGSVVWTTAEKIKCQNAARKYGRDELSRIAKEVGTRTEAQVRAHLRNVAMMERAGRDVAAVARESPDGGGGSASNGIGESGTNNNEIIGGNNKKSLLTSTPSSNTTSGTTTNNAAVSGSGGSSITGKPVKRGGRGKKPPAQAIHTVVNGNFDARRMILGNR